MMPQYRLRGLRFAYAQRPVLDTGDHELPARQIIALTGANGAGKSTLLKLLAFLLVPAAGELRYREVCVDAGNRTHYRRRVGFIPQDPYLLRGSVRYNIELGLRFRRLGRGERVARATKTLRLLGLERLTARPVHSLSGGEAQKVALGRMLALDPEVLLLDEPFTWLDTASVRSLGALLHSLRDEQGKTVVFSSHDGGFARHIADRVYALADGRLREEDAA